MSPAKRADTEIDDRTLGPRELARIRDSLPEAKRWPFMLSLDERIFDALVALAGERKDKRSD